MAIQTNVAVSNDGNGTVNINGLLTGDQGRLVTLTATPSSDRYVFDKWEIKRTGVLTLNQHSYVSFKRDTIDQVCATATQEEALQLSQTLFTFNTQNCTNCIVYTDQLGNTLAPAGYWARGNNTYYLTNFEGRVSSGVCPTGTGDTGGGGGTGGGTGGGGTGIGDSGNTGDGSSGGDNTGTLL